MKKQQKSKFSEMYMITKPIYERLLQCLDDKFEKNQILELNKNNLDINNGNLQEDIKQSNVESKSIDNELVSVSNEALSTSFNKEKAETSEASPLKRKEDNNFPFKDAAVQTDPVTILEAKDEIEDEFYREEKENKSEENKSEENKSEENKSGKNKPEKKSKVYKPKLKICSYCNRTLSTAFSLKRHIETKHSESNKVEDVKNLQIQLKSQNTKKRKAPWEESKSFESNKKMKVMSATKRKYDQDDDEEDDEDDEDYDYNKRKKLRLENNQENYKLWL